MPQISATTFARNYDRTGHSQNPGRNSWATESVLVPRRFSPHPDGRRDVPGDASTMNERRDHLVSFYALLGRLEQRIGGARTLAACSGRMDWPARGVYFFREPGESRTHTGGGPRIVRVGTHALTATSRTKLWSRLSQHKGQQGSGGGNHRGSVFRKIVGGALINREGLDFPAWGEGNSATREITVSELPMERRVSEVIGNMPFLWLSEESDAATGDRGYIERNSIALLSNDGKPPLDPPSPGWLGRQSNIARVRSSGLWNSNHVDGNYDSAFLDTFERLVSATGGRS
jgi:hypothetical protein